MYHCPPRNDQHSGGLQGWHKQWAGQSIAINCDNQAVVAVLTNDRSNDEVVSKYARNILCG